jgi:hypothetical protein
LVNGSAANTSNITDSNQIGTCVQSGIDPDLAKAVSNTISGVLGVVIVTNVAVAVGTAVAGGVAGGVGGGVGGSSSGGGGGGGTTMALIQNVQFLNLLGRVGGSEGSESVAGIANGLGWANYDLGIFSCINDDCSSNSTQRRRLTHRRKSKVIDDAGQQVDKGLFERCQGQADRNLTLSDECQRLLIGDAQ